MIYVVPRPRRRASVLLLEVVKGEKSEVELEGFLKLGKVKGEYLGGRQQRRVSRKRHRLGLLDLGHDPSAQVRVEFRRVTDAERIRPC